MIYQKLQHSKGRIYFWRDDLLGALSQYSEEPYEPWPEDEEKPYFTDKPDWDAYNALRLYAFHALLDKPLPEKFPRRGACEDFISLSEEEKEKTEGLSLCGGAEWWLPLEEQFTFSADTPAGNEAAFGTAGMLAAELKYINDKVWQAGEEEILNWNGTEGYKAEALFTEEGEKALVERYGGTGKLKADVLKVSHHGSRYSTCDEFLEAVDPEIAIIGVGRNNYGHPADEVIEKLRENDIIVYRTDLDGAIGIRAEDGRIEVCTRKRESTHLRFFPRM